MEDSGNFLVVFEGGKIRRMEHEGEWYFSVVDVVRALTGSPKPRQYWTKVKDREFDQLQLSPIWLQLKLPSSDGKSYLTDCANTESMLRIVQSIPSKRAEPFKRWLAKVGYERVQEIDNPVLAQERMKGLYRKRGYSEEWIAKRLRSIAIRTDLEDEWRSRGVADKKGFSILTDEITKASFGFRVEDYREFKSLQKQELCDHMDDIELVLTMLGEATTTRFTRERDSRKIPSLKKDAWDGGTVAGDTRKNIEHKLGKSVVSDHNYIDAPENKKRLAMRK